MKRGLVKKTKKKVNKSKIKTFLDNKKLLAISIAAFFIFAFLLGFVNIRNQSITGQVSLIDGIGQVADSVIQILGPVIKFLIGEGVDETLTGEFLFTRVLLLILMVGIVWNALDRINFFKKQRVVLNITTVVVSLLAVRGMASSDLINTILLPYTALGIALSAGIPFVIYFIVVNISFKKKNLSAFRRIAWAFFAVIFIGLYFMRYDELGDFSYIYPVTAILALIMAIMDGSLSKFFRKHEVRKLKDLFKHEQVLGLRRRIRNLKEDIAEGEGNSGEIKDLIDHLEEKIITLNKIK